MPFVKIMFENLKQSNLFSFILACYEFVDKDEYKNICPANNSWDLASFTKHCSVNNVSFSYISLINYLDKKGLLKELNNKRFVSSVLVYLDDAIFSFEEYQNMFLSDAKVNLENENYYLIILPENCIAKQIDKNYSQKIDNGNPGKGLREKRYFNPNKACHKLGFKHLNFVNKNSLFEIKQNFCSMPTLAKSLKKNIIKIGFFPFVKVNEEGEPLVKPTHGTGDFSLCYNSKVNYQDKYLDYLKKAFSTHAEIIIFPEISNPFSNTGSIESVLKAENNDVNKLVVSGSNWYNNKNTCYVFDDCGKLLVSQDKYNPYCLKKEDGNYYEDLKNVEKMAVNLLHIQAFGLIGFPICSDLLSSKYVESVYCDCCVTDLLVPCMSKSKDIFSSLPFLSSNYLISAFVCNAYTEDNNIIGYYSFPTKDGSKRSSKEFRISNKDVNDTICSGTTIEIDLNKIAK